MDEELPHDFGDSLEKAMSDCMGSTAWSNQRDRPYDGQPHTDDGIRGKTLVEGLTMRDISDCIVQGFLDASGIEELQKRTVERNKEFIGTEHANKGDWLHNDIYKIDCDFDPGAVIQNALCHIEHMMGIFPNLPKKDSE